MCRGFRIWRPSDLDITYTVGIKSRLQTAGRTPVDSKAENQPRSDLFHGGRHTIVSTSRQALEPKSQVYLVERRCGSEPILGSGCHLGAPRNGGKAWLCEYHSMRTFGRSTSAARFGPCRFLQMSAKSQTESSGSLVGILVRCNCRGRTLTWLGLEGLGF